MTDLYLRKVKHNQARDNYRVVLKHDGDETEIGLIGIQDLTGALTAGAGVSIPSRCGNWNPKAKVGTRPTACASSKRRG